MFQLLRRITWVLSLVAGYFLVTILSGENPYIFGDFFSVLLGIGLGILIKNVLFSEKYIQERIRFFADAISGADQAPSNPVDTSEQRTSVENTQEPEESEELEMDIPEQTETSLKPQSVAMADNIPKISYKEPALVTAIKGFFHENVLAKIGGILLFLGVLFFLNLIYSAVGPVEKIVIGILFGFAVYGVGVFLDKKGFQNESRILLGLGILINYLVILSGRYLIGDTYSATDTIPTGVLSTGITFLFLILNTVFGVLTSLLYNSRALLVFSFVFAYLNPLLVGGSSDTPYILLGYATIVSLGGIILMWSKKFMSDSRTLIYISYIGANLLYFIAPFDDTSGWIAKITCFAIMSLGLVYSAYKKQLTTAVSSLLIGTYVIFIAYIILGMEVLRMDMSGSMMYGFSILPLLGISLGAQLLEAKKSIGEYTLSITSFILVGTGALLLFAFPGAQSFWTIGILTFVYIVRLITTSKLGSSISTYITAIALAIFLFLGQGIVHFTMADGLLNTYQYAFLVLVSLKFLGVTYWYSTKDKLSHLYFIGTIGFIINISPLIVINEVGTMMFLSILALFKFFGANILTPFFSKAFLKDKRAFHSFLLGMVSGLVFVVYYTYAYMNMYYPGVTVGFALAGVGIVYFIVTYLCVTFLDIDFKNASKNDLLGKNMILSYGFASLSVLSLAVAFVFSGHQEIITVIWIFESMLLLYFFDSLKEYKIYIVSMILLFIGMINLAEFTATIQQGQYTQLISIVIILLSLFTGTKILQGYTEKKVRIPHDVLHIWMVLILVGAVAQILSSIGAGGEEIGVALFISLLAYLYHIASSQIQKWFFVVLFSVCCIEHIAEVESILSQNDTVSQMYQYIVTVILGVLGYSFAKTSLEKTPRTVLYVVTTLYLFVITTIYIHNIFQTTFVVTIYWSTLAFISLAWGISKDVIKYRTIGLYILFLALGKILFYDIWIGFDDAALRVGALMIVGVMLIVISMMYSKKYGNNLKGEFNLENLK